MANPVLIFPAGMPRSLAYLERALAEGQPVIGSSSLGHDPARERYPRWVHLPYVTAPDFDQALRQAIADFGIGGIFTPNPVVWDYLHRCLPDAFPGVTLHGYQPSARVRQLVDEADIFICTSHDEGLGLPLLEAQYGGLPIIAPDAAIFHEVLDGSGIFIDPANSAAAAAKIAAILSDDQWRSRYAKLAAQNLNRWNALAAADRDAVIGMIAELAGRQVSAGQAYRNRLVER